MCLSTNGEYRSFLCCNLRVPMQRLRAWKESLRQGNWRGALINLDREVAVNIATSAGLIDDRHQISKTPSIEAWAEVEKLLGVAADGDARADGGRRGRGGGGGGDHAHPGRRG